MIPLAQSRQSFWVNLNLIKDFSSLDLFFFQQILEDLEQPTPAVTGLLCIGLQYDK